MTKIAEIPDDEFRKAISHIGAYHKDTNNAAKRCMAIEATETLLGYSPSYLEEQMGRPQPDCCVAQWDEHVACGKECGPTCHFFQNPKGTHIEPCPNCHRELLLIRDTHKFDWGGWRVHCNDTLVGDGGCGYETDVYETEAEAIKVHNDGKT